MGFTFTDAVNVKTFLRMAIHGPSGCGKTYSALRIARGLVGPEGSIALIDTERGSAALYAGVVPIDGVPMVFKHGVLAPPYHPNRYCEAINSAAASGFDCLVIDSLSHAWAGEGGALELKDAATAKRKGDSFSAWQDVTPLQQRLVDTILSYPGHVIATMRAKAAYVLTEVERDGRKKTEITKAGMAPIQRDDLEYEFSIVGQLDQEQNMTFTKARLSSLRGVVIDCPSERFGEALGAWLAEGEGEAVETLLPITPQVRAKSLLDRVATLDDERRELVKSWATEQGIAKLTANTLAAQPPLMDALSSWMASGASVPAPADPDEAPFTDPQASAA